MNTSLAHSAWRALAGAALTLVLASVVLADAMQAAASDPGHLDTRLAPVAAAAPTHELVRSAAPVSPSRYGWPVKPFRQQHPVRGFFGDPRIGNHGLARQFHFGIDISAPNGTAVYATQTGKVWIHPLHPTTVAVVGRDGTEFSYWHVVPTVRTGDHAVAYETVIGRIEAPYGHVHFAESRNGRYLNPLRPGALGPFVDGTRPVVRSLVVRDGMLVAEAYDETPLAVPRPWHDLPVMPAVVRWRVLDTHGGVMRAWSTAVDFRLTIPPASEFDGTWATGVTQNHVRVPGRFRLSLSATDDLRPGRYTVEVAASDVRGNTTRSSFAIDLSGS